MAQQKRAGRPALTYPTKMKRIPVELESEINKLIAEYKAQRQ